MTLKLGWVTMLQYLAHLAGAVEYNDYFSAEG